MKLPRLTDEQKARLLEWADELERTNAEQGVGGLHMKDNEFCCLGIYCNMREPGSWRYNTVSAQYEFYPSEWEDFESETALLPSPFAKEIGFWENNQNVFSVMNDVLRYSFLDIAREIRYIVETGRFTDITTERVNHAVRVHDNLIEDRYEDEKEKE